MSNAPDLGGTVQVVNYTHYKTTDMLTSLIATSGTYAANTVYTLEFDAGLVLTGTVSVDLLSVSFTATAEQLDPIVSGSKMIGVATGSDGIRLAWLFGKVTQVAV